MSENETTTVIESSKSSKLAKVKSAVVTTAWIAVPVVATGGLTFLSYKRAKMNLEAAQLNLEAAQLNKS